MGTKKSYFSELEKSYGQLSFGSFLSSWRQSENLTQKDFAKKLNLSTQNLNDLEKGRRIPTPTRASKIAKKLGLPEVVIIKIAIQDSLHKEGFKYMVSLKAG